MIRMIISLALLASTLSSCLFISEDGCTPGGVCPYGRGQPKNYWYQPERVAVVQPGASAAVIVHELCHGWQGRNLSASDVALDGWFATEEGKSFNPATAWPWLTPNYGNMKLEDAAWTCAYWYLGEGLDAERARWAEKWLP